MKKKFCVYGSCQAPALAQILAAYGAFAAHWECVEIKAIHQLSEDELSQVLSDILPCIDLFIYQPISAEHRGERFSSRYMCQQLRPGTRMLSFPFLHWEGYTPSITGQAWGLGEYFANYVDVLVADVASRASGIENFLEAYAEIGGQLRQNLPQLESWCLAELKNREGDHNSDGRPTDIQVSGFIAQNWKTARLFHTVNHPTRILMAEVARQCMVLMDYVADDALFLITLDPLDSVQSPIFPSLGMHFSSTTTSLGRYDVLLHDRLTSHEDYFRDMYNWFITFPADDISAFTNRVANNRPWLRAELDAVRNIV